MKASSVGKAAYKRDIPALSQMKNIISAKSHEHVAPPKRRGSNKMVPGKGLPATGESDPLMIQQKNAVKMATTAPVASFGAHAGNVLNDATGAIGPNHYVYAFNSGFGILDRSGNPLISEASLGTIFPGETLGDPIVVYDNFADRFIIMEFSNTPNGFLIAVGQGPDPVNDGWYTYRFNTSSFPDYEKLSIWSDGYYVTANKDQNDPSANDVVFVVERDEMLVGNPDAQLIGFPLPAIENNGFYSPGGFNVTGTTLPPVGTGCSIVYLQDDSWSGISQDHLKIWTTSVDWTTPSNSTISSPQELITSPFDSVFDGGSFQNLDEPGSGPDIDALQATMMYMTNYRRFGTHNSVVMNFVVDLTGADSLAGIRWYELRQTADGQPWTVYQEGTYVQPDGLSAFCGSIAQDAAGNIGLAYTVVSSSVYTSLRYTGRLANDPLGTMTAIEQVSANGDQQNTRSDGRYGDYGQMTIDPLDDTTFWHISEYMQGTSNTRKSHVVAFRIEPDVIDEEAPTTPTGLSASGTTARQTTLSWNASADNIGVVGYDIYQDGVNVATSTGTTYTVNGLAPLTEYSFYVVAKDASGNLSGASSSVTITTEESTTGPGCIGGELAPYTESFESSFGLWTQNSGDDLDWSRDSNGTPSNNTGPSNAAAGSTYIYVEASGNGTGYPNKQAILTSPCLDLNDVTTAFFTFSYHMYGSSNFGSLDVEASNDEGITWTSIWSLSGNQGNSWQLATIDLADYIGSGLQLRFNRVTSSTWQADAAIDDVAFTTSDGPSEDCEPAGDLTLSITLDNYPEETSWTITNDGGTTVASASYSSSNPDGSTVTETISGLTSGSYVFTLFDSYGDGICCSYGIGSYTLSSTDGTIVTGGDFDSSEETEFCINVTSVRIDTYELTDLNTSDKRFVLSPMPVKGVLNISAGKTPIQSVEIYSMYGQLVRTIQGDENKQTINVSELAVGTYFTRISAEETVVTRKFVIEQ
ncbi:T9SS type A sorting domain-containing protein [Aquimarina pacifica]|uniref:T9SS type A sorting domain-containing protein n=1 Tax=Aquimarina pacifica TaxID=1296415 RepID=UPI0004B1F2BB|nr:T9SS type A sorting domain-containing protein [Aquimarina pacifica]